MADYQAPLRDMRFVLNEVFDAPSLWASLPKIAENVDPDTADAILEEAGKITSGVLAPLNREADEQGEQHDSNQAAYENEPARPRSQDDFAAAHILGAVMRRIIGRTLPDTNDRFIAVLRH